MNISKGQWVRPAFTKTQAQINHLFQKALPSPSETPTTLNSALHYVTLNGGKRFRPLLAYATAEFLNLSWEAVDPIAFAIECMHCYSLVHDDLPAMDDDDLRRGQPTCHRAFDEATAILVGDALQALAFENLASWESHPPTPKIQLEMIKLLAKACGPKGMVKGQAIDISSTHKTLTLAELEAMHRSKTGALISASIILSAMSHPELSDTQLARLKEYGYFLGLAFQIQDDILDVVGHTQTLGKQQGQDAKHQKPTYPSLLGLFGAKQKAQEAFEAALQSLNIFNETADPLREIAYYVVTRDA